VRRGDGDAAVQPERADREIEHLRADHPDVEHLGTLVGTAADHRLRHLRRGQPHIPPDRHPLRLELLDIPAPDRVGAVLVKVLGVDPAHVVRLEDLRIEHRARS
jgi:hypothetical protein